MSIGTKRPITTELLNRTITTSTTLAWEPAYWAPLAMAEVKTKLLTQEQKRGDEETSTTDIWQVRVSLAEI